MGVIVTATSRGYYCACDEGRGDIALVLVRAGADPEALSSGGKTPLDLVQSDSLRADLIREREKYLA